MKVFVFHLLLSYLKQNYFLWVWSEVEQRKIIFRDKILQLYFLNVVEHWYSLGPTFNNQYGPYLNDEEYLLQGNLCSHFFHIFHISICPLYFAYMQIGIWLTLFSRNKGVCDTADILVFHFKRWVDTEFEDVSNCFHLLPGLQIATANIFWAWLHLLHTVLSPENVLTHSVFFTTTCMNHILLWPPVNKREKWAQRGYRPYN